MENWTGHPTMVSEPGQDDTRYVLTDGELGVTNPEDVSAWVVCYNPKGKVPGALAARLLLRPRLTRQLLSCR